MLNNLKQYTFAETIEVLNEVLLEKPSFLRRIEEICDKYEELIEHLIDSLKNNLEDHVLSEIDMINAIRINQILPYFILEDDYEGMHRFANAWILIQQNFIAMTGDKNKRLEESVSIVAKLLRCEFNFSRLIYLSEMLLNKYEYIQKQADDMESYKLSKLYIDKIIGNNEDKDK